MKNMIKRFVAIFATLLTILLTILASILYFSINWMFDTWSNLSMDELMFHLTAPLEGTNEGMVREYINTSIVPTVLILIFLIIVFISTRKQLKYYFFMICLGIVSILVSVKTICGAMEELGVGNYVKAQGTYSTFIDNNYIDPIDVKIDFPDQKRNLIYIFLESVETTYSDIDNGGAFEDNFIPELTTLAQNNEDFSGDSKEINGGYAMPGATWTIGAMFSQTSGIPLSIPIDMNSMDTQDTFFANTITLGDILQKEGYSQNLLIGSDAAFGGRRLYFTEHGNYNILDYNFAIEEGWIPEDYRVWWGYEDQKLFEFAKNVLLKLSDEKKPFNLTMLTVDTHFEDGYLCDLCPDTYGENQYANVIACSSKQIGEFVSWIQKQEFYANTTIVISGDHLTMDSDFCEEIGSGYGRRVYTSYINSAEKSKTTEMRYFTTFDYFPTTLAAMGVNIDGDRLGLGTNLFSEKPTLAERFGVENEREKLTRKSKMMEELNGIDESKEKLYANEDQSVTATVIAGEYDFITGTLPVTVTNIIGNQDRDEALFLAVWTEEDQRDLQWIPMQIQENGDCLL